MVRETSFPIPIPQDSLIAVTQQQGKNFVWLKPLILLAIFFGLTALFYKSGWIQFFLDRQRMIRFLDSLGAWGFAGFILLQVIQVVAAPIPGEATGFLGGFLYGPYIGVILSTIGLTLGSYIAFSLSRTLGRPFMEKAVDVKTMGRFDYLLHHKGAFLIFLLFLLPGFPKDYLCYILGLGHLTTLEFLAIATTGRLLGTVLLTLGGNFLRHKQYGWLFFLAGVAIVIIFVTIAYKDKIERIFRSLHERRHKP